MENLKSHWHSLARNRTMPPSRLEPMPIGLVLEQVQDERGRFGFDAGDEARGACGDDSESP